MEYIIVPMDRGHIPQIAALERECFSTPWSENMLSDALFDPKASFIVAEDGEGGVLGYAGLPGGAGRGLHRQHRRGGGRPPSRGGGCPSGRVLPLRAGPSLLPDPGGAGLQRPRHRPVPQAWLSGGGPARKNYYQQPREDAIIMTREFEHHEAE